MKFMSILLREGRKEDLKKKYSDKFDEQTLDWILNISDLVDFNHKYTDFVLRVIDPEIDATPELVDVIIDLLKLFDRNQSQLQKKDINQYKDLIELESALSPFRHKEELKRLESQVDKIYEDEKFLVIRPKTHQASCKYGANTKWCTTSQSPDHFERYTSGNQGLYYIINKENSTNQYYSKVAIHFDNSGSEKYWDSKDSPLSNREIEIFNYAFPVIIDAIREDHKQKSVSSFDLFLNEVFNTVSEKTYVIKNIFSSGVDLELLLEGFNTIEDMSNHAEGDITISLDNKIIDSYRLFITFSPSKIGTFNMSVGLMGVDPSEDTDFIDLGLEGWGFDSKVNVDDSIETTSLIVKIKILSQVSNKLKENPKLQEKVIGSKKVWQPDRIGYGYTFEKNKGLIKKLVEWLSQGKIGNKLDFLVDIGKLDKKVENGKKFYSQKGKNQFSPSVNWRGHFASFFASAKMAGILDYRKMGNQFLLTKGPNYDAFIQGELKAL